MAIEVLQLYVVRITVVLAAIAFAIYYLRVLMRTFGFLKKTHPSTVVKWIITVFSLALTLIVAAWWWLALTFVF